MFISYDFNQIRRLLCTLENNKKPDLLGWGIMLQYHEYSNIYEFD